ncbi:MAG TPA: DMT family transporter [Casimicrobiaceae bacterium]|nr:DMT family transporter [Casimicrobiaceae bacterium]
MHRALPMFLLAGLCLSSLDATAKYLVRDHSLFVIVWARYVGQMLVVTPFAWQRSGPGFWRTRHPALQLVRSAFLLLATVFFFAGLRFLPLAEASSIMYLAPMFIVLLCHPVLRERPTRGSYIATLIGFVGVVVLLRPGSNVLHPAALLVLAAALSNALYQVLTRRLLDENPHTTLFYSGIVGAAGLSLGLPFAFDASLLSWRESAFLAILGLCSGLGHWLITGAYLRAPAALLTPFTYLQLVWATLYGYALFAQLPDRWSALGMVVIVASGLLLALQQRSQLARKR